MTLDMLRLDLPARIVVCRRPSLPLIPMPFFALLLVDTRYSTTIHGGKEVFLTLLYKIGNVKDTTTVDISHFERGSVIPMGKCNGAVVNNGGGLLYHSCIGRKHYPGSEGALQTQPYPPILIHLAQTAFKHPVPVQPLPLVRKDGKFLPKGTWWA